jgi:hypothetical protein
MRDRHRTGAILGVLGCAILAGCSTTVVRKGVERRVERRLHSVLGPAERYRVRIKDTRDSELVLGKARRVEVEGDRIRAKGQFLVESLRLTLTNLRYEGGEPYFVSVERSDLQVEFTDQTLNEYLSAYHPRNEPHVTFHPDVVTVRMVYGFLGKRTPITATGRLVVEDGLRLVFDAEKVDTSLINTPGFGEKFVEERVNPLLDLSRIEFPARLESIQVLEGRIRAHGSATLPREVR